MIQLHGVSPLTTNSIADPSIVAAANQAAGDSFQSQLAAALTATLQKFGIDPSRVALSIAPLGSGASPALPSAGSPSSVTPPVPSLPGSGGSASKDPLLSFDDAYWANQPPAVRALRDIGDPGQRSLLAGQLIASGYQIDTPIMVWGWDPSKVTSLRHGFGYSWVPSGFQNPIAEAPGIDDHGSQPYDPNHPPSGSIAV